MAYKGDYVRRNSPLAGGRSADRERECLRGVRNLLEITQQDISRDQFGSQVLRAVCEQVGGAVGELRLVDRGGMVRWRYTRDNGEVSIDTSRGSDIAAGVSAVARDGVDEDVFERLMEAVAAGFAGDGIPAVIDQVVSRVTERGAVSIDDTVMLFAGPSARERVDLGMMRSLAVLPMVVEGRRRGVLVLGSREAWHFGPEMMGYLEETAAILGVALAHREARRDLRERVKEMTCLYGMVQVAANPKVSSQEFLEQCVKMLPAAFRHPEHAAARIVFDRLRTATDGFPEEGKRLTATIRFGGRERGQVEVAYTVELPDRDVGPFLAEERALLETVAENLAVILEQRQASAEVHGLLDQLRHADRLATIGQVTAGVVHELNEPLGSILGFAQLAKKSPGLAGQTRQDIDKIVAAALHAREVVKRLMLFARRVPPRRNRVSLNEVIAEGLYFLASRCERMGIELERDLQPDLPELVGDASQLYQVLVNLVVNAIQAMPEGGCITIRTEATDDAIVMSVADTGIGMSEEVRAKAMQPFFTTKSVTEGTGLGLAVVSGIVEAHGGTISIESEEGRGSRFTIRLPRGASEDEAGEAKRYE